MSAWRLCGHWEEEHVAGTFSTECMVEDCNCLCFEWDDSDDEDWGDDDWDGDEFNEEDFL